MLTWKIEDEDFVEENVEMEDVELLRRKSGFCWGVRRLRLLPPPKRGKGNSVDASENDPEHSLSQSTIDKLFTCGIIIKIYNFRYVVNEIFT